MPDRSSAHVNETTTSASYQPAPLAARSGTPLIVGLALSMLTVAGSVAEFPALSTAVPGTGCAWPGIVTGCGPVRLATPESASAQWNVTVTSVLFQPLSFASGDWVWPIVGLVL